VKNKLRTLYAGAKKDNLIGRIASTFTSLCENADFSSPRQKDTAKKEMQIGEKKDEKKHKNGDSRNVVSLDSLQYHINIVLPETRDQSVYDAIFRSLKEHLGRPQ